MTRPINPRAPLPVALLAAAAHLAAAVLLAAAAVLAAAGCDGEATPCRDAWCAAIPTGTTPNDVALSTCGDAQVALVPASGEARLDAIGLASGDIMASTLFPVVSGPDGDRFAQPWAVASTADGTRAAVTLYGQDRVAWVDPCKGEVLSTATVDGAVTPQPVVLAGGRVITAFTNVRQYSLQGEPPVLDDGVIAAFTVADDILVLAQTHTTTGNKNPQGLAVTAGGDVLVSLSGPLARGPDGGQAAVAPGAILLLDGAHLGEKIRIDAGLHAPGTAALVGDRVVVGSLVDPELFAPRLTDAALDGLPVSARLVFDGPAVEALFDVVAWDGTTALVTQFSADALRVVHVDADGLRLDSTVAVGPGGTAFRGMLAVDARPEVTGTRIDAVGLLGLSAELVPLALRSTLDGAP